MNTYQIKHLSPLIALLLLAIIVYIFGFSHHFTLENLEQKEAFIMSWVHLHPILSTLTFFIVFVVSICLFIPASTILTLVAAMTYPAWYAFFLSVFSETIGTFLFFLILRFAFPMPKGTSKDLLGKTEKSFQKHPASYLLFLRFSHFTPSWLISSLAALFNTKSWTFIWTTFLGCIPLVYLVVETGKTVKLATKGSSGFNWHNLFTTEIKLLFLAFGLISLLPVLINKYKKH